MTYEMRNSNLKMILKNLSSKRRKCLLIIIHSIIISCERIEEVKRRKARGSIDNVKQF